MNGHLSGLHNRLKIRNFKTNLNRKRVAKIKQLFLEHDVYNSTETKSGKPKLSESEMKILKQNIRRKIILGRRNLIFKRALIMVIIVLLILIIRKIIA